MLILAKFGGSSLSNSTQFKKVKDIVLSDENRKIVVISALGKREKDDTKITDLLYILHAHIKHSVPYNDIWEQLYTRFVGIKDELSISYEIKNDLDLLKSELNKNINLDYLVSRGEYLTAKLISSYLGYQFVDAKDIIIFKFDGNLDEKLTEDAINKAFKEHKNICVPGFYGSYKSGGIKLLSRGGSDITGAILSRYLNVSLYENWTDVSGVLSADPRIIDNPRSITELTYTELRELSYMGANVLHEETIYPIRHLNIPINLKNTNEPTHLGTLIKENCTDNSNLITGIAGKSDFVAFNISKNYMSNEVGFLRKTLSVFEKYHVSVEHIPSGIDSFAVVVNSEQVEKNRHEIINDLNQEFDANVTIDEDIALVAVVGRNMATNSGICAKIFNTLGEENISVKLLAQGPSELSIIIGVAKVNYKKSIKVLYDTLFQGGKK